jgi:LmbE family N-acetylglucosaminyl deacetylase
VTPPLLVVSPHLDDAALGAGALLAAHPGATVITVFAGRPPGDAPLPPWDEAAGFRLGDDVVGQRRTEDRAALRQLDAHPIWLEFLDAQYAAPPPRESIARALEHVLHAEKPGTVCIPLGLFHTDHELAHTAALAVLARHPGWRWLAYEEPMYRRVPGALSARLGVLHAAGIHAAPIAGPAAPDSKRRALACYASQLRALGRRGRAGHGDALAPERYWMLSA